MLNWLKKDPKKKLEDEYNAIMIKARDVQITGDLKEYTKLIERSKIILRELKLR